MIALRKSGRRVARAQAPVPGGTEKDGRVGKKKRDEGRTDCERRRNQQPLAASTWWCGARGVLNYAATLELTCRHVHRVYTGSSRRRRQTRAEKCAEKRCLGTFQGCG